MLGVVAGGGVIDEFEGGVEVFVSVAVVGGVGSLAVPLFSDGAAPTCDEWSLGGGPAAWCASSCNASASSGCRLTGGAWFGDGSAWVGDPWSVVGASCDAPPGDCETAGGVSACVAVVSDGGDV